MGNDNQTVALNIAGKNNSIYLNIERVATQCAHKVYTYDVNQYRLLIHPRHLVETLFTDHSTLTRR